jgi:hypothetical protein
MSWDLDYPINKFEPPKDYKLEAVDTDKNRVVEREQLKDCKYLSKLIALFKEEYVMPEVNSVLLIRKQKEGTGFQNWHIDLAKNGQIVYTICVNIGSMDIQADSGEINYPNANDNAFPPTLIMMMKRQRQHMSVTVKARISKRLLATKKVLQRKPLLHPVFNFLMTKPILTPSKVILVTSFGCLFQETVTQGVSFWVDLKI